MSEDNFRTNCKHCGAEDIFELVEDGDDRIVIALMKNKSGLHSYEFRHIDGYYNVSSFEVKRCYVSDIIEGLKKVLEETNKDSKLWVC